MKKIATGAVFAALVVAGIAPVAAASRPKPATVDASALLATMPVSFASSDSSSSVTVGDASYPVPVYTSLNQGLLGFFKADLDFEGAVHSSLISLGIDPTTLDQTYGKLDASILGLIAYLQTTTTPA